MTMSQELPNRSVRSSSAGEVPSPSEGPSIVWIDDDMQAELDLKASVWSAAKALIATPRFRALKSSLDQGLVARFLKLQAARIDDVGLDHSGQLDHAIGQIRTALQAVEIRICNEIDAGKLEGRLTGLLHKHLSLCPLCKRPYTCDEEWVLDLLLLGHARLVCSCADMRYAVGKEPELLREHEVLYRYSGKDLVSLVPGEFRMHILTRLTIGGRTAVSLALDVSGRVVIAVDRETLKTIKGDVHLVDVWAQTKTRATDRRAEAMEEQIVYGDALKLRLHWDERRQNWCSYGPSSAEVYVVHADAAKTVTAAGWYYVHLVNPGPKSRKEDGRVRIIGICDLIPVPSRFVPNQSPTSFRPLEQR